MYSLPDSSLPLTTYFFSCHHSDSVHRSRMTAVVNCVFLGSKYLPVILERSEESRQRIQDLNVLTCVRKLAPIASQARHFPPSSGEADTKEERIHFFKMYYLIVAIKR